MRNTQLSISGFKCFEKITLNLNEITVLTGANASGKSTVIQSLLLMKASEDSVDISLSDARYAFDMGDKDALINSAAKDEVEFVIDNARYRFMGSENTPKGRLRMHLDGEAPFFGPAFYYLSAERQGPRYDVKADETVMSDCGCHGQDVANVINNNQFTEVDSLRSKGKGNFSIQLDNWLDFIFPNVSVKVRALSDSRCQVTIRANQVTSVATNVGFGISYALPIIVEGLLAEQGSWLIVENPEAHLHAKAQSNMGYFLAVMAASGVRVILETHSEHIVNGIRRAAVNDETQLQPNDINIYFMCPDRVGEADLIGVDEWGNLSDFPVDFFDQSRQDLLEIINLSSK